MAVPCVHRICHLRRRAGAETQPALCAVGCAPGQSRVSRKEGSFFFLSRADLAKPRAHRIARVQQGILKVFRGAACGLQQPCYALEPMAAPDLSTSSLRSLNAFPTVQIPPSQSGVRTGRETKHTQLGSQPPSPPGADT